jgi:hypothetical protein
MAHKKPGGVGRGPRQTLPAAPQEGSGGKDLRFDCNIATISSRLGKGREPSVEAKLCELDDKAFGPDFL